MFTNFTYGLIKCNTEFHKSSEVCNLPSVSGISPLSPVPAKAGWLRTPDVAMKRSTEAKILSRLREAFLQHGFKALSMAELAQAAGFSRRALYYRYPNKEAAYRAMIRWQNEDFMAKGIEAGSRVRAAGGTPVDIFSEILDVRFGVTRRMVESSPHSVELNAVAFAICRDIAIDVAIRFQHDLASLIASLVDEGVMRLRPTFSAALIAEILSYGARGVNQALPPVPVETLAQRYHHMCAAVLLGASVQAPKPRPKRRTVGQEGTLTGT